MSEFTTLALMVAIVMPDLYLYMLLDRVRKERENEIVTGVIHGVAVSTSYRWILLYTSWLTPASFLIGIRIIMTPVYLTMAGSVGTEGLRFIAHVFAFWGFLGALIYLAFTLLWFVHLRSVLLQAEAD